MSLILEALRKLDREKRAPQRGFLVMAPVALSSAPRRIGLWLVAAAIGLVACVSGAAWWLLAGRPARQPVVAAAASTPTTEAPRATLAPATAPPVTVPVQPLVVEEPGIRTLHETSEARAATSRTAVDEAPAATPTTLPAPPIPAPALSPTAPPRTPDRRAVQARATTLPTPVPAVTAPTAPAKPAQATPAPRREPAADDQVQLQAISHQDGVPVAVVNDRLVREGDSFDGIRVVRIGAAEVEIEVRGRRRVVRF
jgi:hypothetical protein